METCAQHQDMVINVTKLNSSIEALQKSFDEVKDKITKHICEGEGPGGVRERLFKAENDLAQMKKNYWISCIVAGVIGGLIGHLTPQTFEMLIKVLVG
jgi:hypothetical protein